ncbi:MAG TPA: TIGR04283 family arsenosugar biosynthesis glycosyltransferase [Planctomycetaceae bacterium]|nr:TIGR04283 family arsenosugar biosynthesis glycosyltransferase [Planctomycetaceae bacterium]
MSDGVERRVTVSVIIPALQEARNIGAAIASARAGGADEILVVDGGSTDGTLELARSADVVLSGTRGRARQQNAGAERSRGDVLLFLHADCRLAMGACEQIRSALADPAVIGGCFCQRIDAMGWRYRVVERGNLLRVLVSGWMYGDQGLFIRREVFERLGGFPEVRLMEDWLLSRRLVRAGRTAVLPGPLLVSARRWQQAGLVRQTLRNWLLLMLASAGVPPDNLARWYPTVR